MARMSRGNVVIAGAYPPPIGGVTIHIKRLKVLLDNSGYRNNFVNIRPIDEISGGIDKKLYIKSLFNCIRKARNGVLHYQLNNWPEASLLLIASKIVRAKIIFTVHSFRVEEFSFIKRCCFRISRKCVSVFIAPSTTTRDKLLLNEVDELKILIINPYLPPTDSELNEPVPQELEKFINQVGYVVLANASKLYRNEDNTDIYGLDMCIEACARISEISFVFCVPIIEDMLYFNECVRKIKQLGVDDRFMIYNKNISMVSLFRYVDIFVRPTSTDSFGVSVAEAISCGIPAIASDVCKRADGAIVFKTRDLDDLIRKIKYCLEREEGNRAGKIQVNHIKPYIDLYNSIIQ